MTEQTVSTDLAFSIVNSKRGELRHSLGEIADVFAAMYPGIKYSFGQMTQVEKQLAKPGLAAMHPQLAAFKTAAEAITALGDTLPLSTVRPVKGYSWDQ